MEENEIQDLLNAVLFSQTPQWNNVVYNPSKCIHCQILIQELCRWVLGNNTYYKKLPLLVDQLFFGLWKIIISNKRQLIFTTFYMLLHTLRNKQTNKHILYQILFAPTFNFLLHAADSHAPSFNLDPLTDSQHCTNPVINITKSAERLMHTPLSCYNLS